MSDYQLFIIGAGPGGYEAALRAAQLGLRTAVAEGREVGGTCLNRGCVPTKALLHAAQLKREAETGGEWGLSAPGAALDFAAAHRKKDQVVAQLRAGIEGLFRQRKIDLFRGAASILGPGQVAVDERTFTAERILIATGSVPARPPIPGLELAMTSDELLEDQGRVYGSLVIIGGGVIGMEFATLYSALGCRVTVIEAMDRILPGMDREVCQNLSMILKKRGVELHVSAPVSAVERGANGLLTVRFTEKGQPAAAEGEAVLCAIGRRPNTEGLFGPGFSLEMDRGRIRVNENLETSVPGVFAIGDVSAPIQLAHVAAAQGRACAQRLAGGEGTADLSLVPACVYTDPEIACVGLTADAAKAAGRAVKTGKFVMFSNARTVIDGGERGFIKAVADGETGVLLGAQLMCRRATDMISQFTAAIANGLTAEQMLAFIRPHPTFEEGIGAALEDLAEKLKREKRA